MEKITDRLQMPELLEALGLRGKYVEVGVDRGTYSQMFVNKGIYSHYYLVDPWLHSHVESPDVWDQERLDISYLTVKKRFEKDKRVELIRDLSVCAAKRFKDGELDFVYIDALHDFDSVTEDMNAWYPKLKVGGMFAGHDWELRQREGCVAAVRKFMAEHGLSFDVTTVDSEPFYTWYTLKI
jgi:hypothetical protein